MTGLFDCAEQKFLVTDINCSSSVRLWRSCGTCMFISSPSKSVGYKSVRNEKSIGWKKKMNWCAVVLRILCAALFSLLILGWPAIVLTKGFHKEHDACAACVVNETSLETKLIEGVDVSVLLSWVPMVSLFMGCFLALGAKSRYDQTTSLTRSQWCVVACVVIPSAIVWMILIGINASVYSTEVCAGCSRMLDYVKDTMWYCVVMCVLSTAIGVSCIICDQRDGGNYGVFGGEV